MNHQHQQNQQNQQNKTNDNENDLPTVGSEHSFHLNRNA